MKEYMTSFFPSFSCLSLQNRSIPKKIMTPTLLRIFILVLNPRRSQSALLLKRF